jgi:hypothetical protein
VIFTEQRFFPPQQPIYQIDQPQENAQQRTNQRFNPKNIWQPFSNGKVNEQGLAKYQNSSVPNLNVQELSQDLLKLKEQLKQLAERG